jgi:hypothetical protein
MVGSGLGDGATTSASQHHHSRLSSATANNNHRNMPSPSTVHGSTGSDTFRRYCTHYEHFDYDATQPLPL